MSGRLLLLFILILTLAFSPPVLDSVRAEEEEILPPAVPIPREAAWLLEVAAGEVGYHEEDHGRTKYGEWAGDPYAQWCAEFICWCASRVDEIHGTSLLGTYYPLWSSSNTGRAWFIRAGRWAVRTGEVEGWGYEWLRGETTFLRTGSYIPQPGDYVFFTWTSGSDTSHVALVEYCTRKPDGSIWVHVIEGNNPDSVARNVYPLTNSQILGYGTASDLVDITMRFGNDGEKVRQLQDKLVYLELLDSRHVTGHFGRATGEAVQRFQAEHGLRGTGIADLATQHLMDEEVDRKRDADPLTWLVVEDE